MKYCIGCSHLCFTPADPGYNTEWTAGINSEDASLSCKRGYWLKHLSDDGDLFDIEKAMQLAETCKHYKERDKATQGE